MSTRTQRINLLVTPEEKAAIEARAAAAHMSVSEHIRMAALVWDASADEIEEVQLLADEVGRVADRLHAKLDESLAYIDEVREAQETFRRQHRSDG